MFDINFIGSMTLSIFSKVHYFPFVTRRVQFLSSDDLKAETHDATNRCDTSPRQVAATNRLV